MRKIFFWLLLIAGTAHGAAQAPDVLKLLHSKLPQEYLWILKASRYVQQWNQQTKRDETALTVEHETVKSKISHWSTMTRDDQETMIEMAQEYATMWLQRQSTDLLTCQHLLPKIDPSSAGTVIKLIKIKKNYMSVTIEPKES